MNRTYIIVNPISGRGAGERAIPAIKEALQVYGLEHEIACTERPWHAAELAQQACRRGFQVVAAVGGDGTANEVLNGLMMAREAGQLNGVAMGVVGVGRGNDLAFGVGVPAGLEIGLRTLAQGRRVAVDVGRVVGGLYPGGRYFGNGVGIGFDAVVGFEALKVKSLPGFLGYLVAALKTIFLYYRAPRVTIDCDGQVITQSSLMVSVMNGRRMGGGFLMAPQARADDGLFDLCIASQVSRARILALIPRFMKGTQATHPAVKTVQARRVVVTALEGTLPAHADGETLCTEGRELAMEILPGQIEIMCPPEGATA